MEGDIGESELLVFLSMIEDVVVGYFIVGEVNEVIRLIVILVISKDDDGVDGIGLVVVVVDDDGNVFEEFAESINRLTDYYVYTKLTNKVTIGNLLPIKSVWKNDHFSTLIPLDYLIEFYVFDCNDITRYFIISFSENNFLTQEDS